MNVVSFKAEHLKMIEDAGGRTLFGPFPFQEGYAQMCADSAAWSIFDGAQILGIGGVSQDHAAAGTAWSMLLPVTRGRMVGITRVARAILNACPLARVQAHAVVGFDLAHKWLDLLGFQREGLLRKFAPDGGDVLIFARVR